MPASCFGTADTVADIRPYVYKNVLFVMGLRMSGGTRQKVLLGMTMAKAAVSISRLVRNPSAGAT